MALPTAVFSQLFARLNVVVSLAIIGVSFYIFYNLLRNLSLGRVQLKAEMAALARDVELLKRAMGLEDGAPDGRASPPLPAKAGAPVAVSVVTTAAASQQQQQAEDLFFGGGGRSPPGGAKGTATTDASDMFEVVSISSNEIKDMLGGLAAAMDLNAEFDDDEQDLENFVVDNALAEAISAAAAEKPAEKRLSEADVKNMKVEELRELGAKLGLESTRGSKGQLMSKVLAALGHAVPPKAVVEVAAVAKAAAAPPQLARVEEVTPPAATTSSTAQDQDSSIEVAPGAAAGGGATIVTTTAELLTV